MAVFWKTGYFKCDAEEAYKEISTLDEITVENVVELASNESSVIHDEFEWDNEIAGGEWRKFQARRLIQNLVVEVEEPETKEPVQIRVLHTTPDRHDYKPVEFFVKNVDEHQKLLNQAKRELESFKKKYYSLVELTPVFEAINAI
jgi:hypothetical protein